MKFLSRGPRYALEKPYTLRFTPLIPFARSNIETDCRRDLIISDIRGKEYEFTLQRNCFTIMRLASKLTYDGFKDTAKVVDIYLPEVTEKTCDFLGAEKVVSLEHIVIPSLVRILDEPR